MADAELMYRPATELAAMVRDGEISAQELVTCSLERIEELDPEINAFIDVFAEEALAEAEAVKPGDERPLAGVPIAIKNNRPVAGARLMMGSDLLGDHRSSHDAFLVQKLRGAGAIVVGTTNLPEFGATATTEPRRFGATHNPWDLTRTPGGSSGGSAAAVAAGMVPLAHANDGGGSTRIPAACCGLVGLKAQRGRVSQGPDIGGSMLVSDLVVSRTTAESAVVLDIMAGYEPGDSYWATPPERPFAEQMAQEPRGLRIASTTLTPLEGTPVDPVCVQAVADAAELLREMGHEVVEVDPPWQVPGMLELFSAVFGPQVALGMAFGLVTTGHEPGPENVEPMSLVIWEQVQQMTGVMTAGADVQLQALSRSIVAWMADFDMVLTPSLAEAPVPLGTIDTCAADPMGAFARAGQFTPYTAIANCTGSPAISVPLFHRDDLDLPLGVQLMGQPESEGALLALAAALEEARPWADRRAPVGAGS
ncbi:MAG: amidase [Solirubrobacterales bacterium]